MYISEVIERGLGYKTLDQVFKKKKNNLTLGAD